MQPFNHPSYISTERRVTPESLVDRDTAPARPGAPRRPRGPSGIQRYTSHHQLFGVCNMIQRELEALWQHEATVHELVITMNGYDLEGHFLDYVFKKVTSIIRELQAYILVGQDISSVIHDSLSSFIENIIKELATTGRSLPFMTSESTHGTVEKCLVMSPTMKKKRRLKFNKH